MQCRWSRLVTEIISDKIVKHFMQGKNIQLSGTDSCHRNTSYIHVVFAVEKISVQTWHERFDTLTAIAHLPS